MSQKGEVEKSLGFRKIVASAWICGHNVHDDDYI